MKWQAYPKYKDSNIEWMGEIPEHWDIWKTAQAFQQVGSGTTPKSDDLNYYDGDIPWVTTSELRESTILDTKSKLTEQALKDYSSLHVYLPGTLLVAMYGATIGRMGILGIPATVNQACCAFASPKSLDPKFTYYWLWMRRPILVALSKGGGQPNLSQDDLRNIRIPAPSLPEQRAIAAFLDRETERLDALIARKERQIELLQEKRAALISHIVTKGLNPNAPMKDSGIEWLGEIPAHWGIAPLKYLTTCLDGRRIPLNAEERAGRQGPYPYWGANGIVDHIDDWLFDEQLVLLGEDGAPFFDSYKDVAFVVQGKIWVNNHIHVLRPKNSTSPYFLAQCLNIVDYGLFIEGSTRDKLTQGKMNGIPIQYPPPDEQHAMAAFLNREAECLDTLVKKVQESIAKLCEHRTALITAAVTGKIQVQRTSEVRCT